MMMLTGSLPALALLLVAAAWSVQAQEEEEMTSRQQLRVPAHRVLTSSSCRAHRLRECEYDCNQDCDCKDGLVCYHREERSKGKYFFYGGLRDYHIPGCSKRPSNYRDDYCINPYKFPAKTLWYIGSDGGTSQGQPAWLYPLKECWGDCDKDEDWYVWRR
jgi:hypothetical protein